MIARAVERLAAKGRTGRAAGAIILRGHVDDDRLPRLRIVEAVDRHARDQPSRQVEQYVDHPLEPEPRERLGELRPDALEVGESGKERGEDFGSHGVGMSSTGFTFVLSEGETPPQPAPGRCALSLSTRQKG